MKNNRLISCILPIYNNEETVGRTIDILLSIPSIHEIIAIDDGSTDNSYKIMKGYKDKIILIQNEVNLGKGGAFVKGLSIAKGDLILTCDGDHRNLRAEHLENIINAYLEGKHHMVLAARETDKGRWAVFMGKITGERIFEKKAIDKYMELLTKSRFGMEQIINHAHNNKSVGFVVSKDIKHIHKFRRKNIPLWLFAYIKQVGEMIKTSYELRKIKQD